MLTILWSKWKTYQRDAKTPNVGSDVIVRLTGVRRVYSLRLNILTHTNQNTKTPRDYTSAGAQSISVLYTLESISQSVAEHSSLGLRFSLWKCLLAHRHVSGTAGAAGFSFGVDEAAADSKIAELDLTFSVQQDVWGLHVSVDDAMLLLQVQQSLYYLRSEERKRFSAYSLNSAGTHCRSTWVLMSRQWS